MGIALAAIVIAAFAQYTSLPDGPNIILISVDCFRADRTGYGGYHRGTTPNIDSFADGNLVFETHLSPIGLTVPAHSSMFTGLYPPSHGVLNNGIKLPQDHVTLAEALADEGYETGAFISSHIMGKDTDLQQGFSDYVYSNDVPADITVERSIRWLDENKGGRFFLFMHLFDPHSPYEPPAGYDRWGGNESDLYDGEVLFTDEHLGRFLDWLKDEGLYDDSLIVLTGDHGESLGERDYYGHDHCIYDICLRVPMIMHLPGGRAGRIEAQTSHIDIYPTVLSIAGVSHPDIEGVDILSSAPKEREFIFALRRLHTKRSGEMGRTYAIRNRTVKYIWGTSVGEELYDIGLDPGEWDNAIATRPAQAESLRTRLFKWRQEGERIGEPIKGQQRERLLREMGYI